VPSIPTSTRGVGARLLLAFFGISAFSALVAVAAIYAFYQVGQSLTLIDRRIDPILASLEVSRSVERIVNSSSNLSSVTTEEARERVFAGLSSKSTKLHSLLNELRDGGIGSERLGPIEEKAVQLDANLTALDADVRLRLQLIGRIKDLMRGVFDTNDETQRLLSPTLLVYDSQIGRLIALMDPGQGQEPVWQVFQPLVAGLLAERKVQRVQQQTSDVADALAQASVNENKQRLLILAFQLRRKITDLEKGAQDLDSKLRPLFLTQVEKFKTLADSPTSIPLLRQHELELIADANRLVGENSMLSDQLTAAAEQLVDATKQEVRAATGSALHIQRLSTETITALVALSVLTSILIVWLYVGRNILARLNRLNGTMFAIAAGDRDSRVTVTGRDEIAAMGRAVEVFRQNAIERDELLAERATAAERLEHLVDERTAELSEALEQQTATAEVLQVINSSPGNLVPVFDAMLDKAMQLCNAAFGVLQTYDGRAWRTVATHGVPSPYAEFRRNNPPAYTHAGTAPARLLAGERVVHIVDLKAEDAYRSGEPNRRALVDKGSARTSLHVALVKDDEVRGCIQLYHSEVRPFSLKQITLLENFAGQAVIAMDNARLLDEIRQRQAELRVTFDNMGDGVAMFDGAQRLVAWNHNFQQILDLPEVVFVESRTFADLVRFLAVRGEFGTAIDAEAELRRFTESAGRHYSYERTRPDGRVLEVRHNPIPDGGFVVIYSDITPRKRAEEEIREARDAAEMALGELKTAQASLIQAEKMASLGQLTAGIAHEIKNPLNFVNNFAGLSVELLDELKEATVSLNEEKRSEVVETIELLTGNLEKIAEHGKRADNIVKSMLEHSRGMTGERREVDLNGLIDEALNLAYHGARAQDQNFNIALEREFDPTLAPIELAPQEITRVFLNLFGNGFYAANKRTHSSGDASFQPVLVVSTRDLGEAVEVRVRDNGTGIPADIKDKLFQPFFTTKPTGEGTGLGLSISYDIITQQHGGTITVESELGAYTEFTVRLPRPEHRTARGRAA
jgi:signal transduction histidine kinase/HAMP domain-containing protein